MHKFTFDMKLAVTLTVEAATEHAARELLRLELHGADTNFGAWPNGDPILGECHLQANSVKLALIDGDTPKASESALEKARNGAGDLIGKGKRFELYNDDRHGFTLIRLTDAKVATFHGDDSCEHFRDHFHGDEFADDDDAIAENAEPTDDVGAWAEDEGEF